VRQNLLRQFELSEDSNISDAELVQMSRDRRVQRFQGQGQNNGAADIKLNPPMRKHMLNALGLSEDSELSDAELVTRMQEKRMVGNAYFHESHANEIPLPPMNHRDPTNEATSQSDESSLHRNPGHLMGQGNFGRPKMAPHMLHQQGRPLMQLMAAHMQTQQGQGPANNHEFIMPHQIQGRGFMPKMAPHMQGMHGQGQVHDPTLQGRVFLPKMAPHMQGQKQGQLQGRVPQLGPEMGRMSHPMHLQGFSGPNGVRMSSPHDVAAMQAQNADPNQVPKFVPGHIHPVVGQRPPKKTSSQNTSPQLPAAVDERRGLVGQNEALETNKVATGQNGSKEDEGNEVPAELHWDYTAINDKFAPGLPIVAHVVEQPKVASAASGAPTYIAAVRLSTADMMADKKEKERK